MRAVIALLGLVLLHKNTQACRRYSFLRSPNGAILGALCLCAAFERAYWRHGIQVSEASRLMAQMESARTCAA